MLGGVHAMACGSEVTDILGIVWCEATLTRLVAVNNIDGRQSMLENQLIMLGCHMCRRVVVGC
jgi:hypothetical protein